jgi:conjugative relaxase-like TrwC/TraI family protein
MLRFHQNTSAAEAKSYYTQADYYLEGGQETAGLWGGKAAVLLGLRGKVDKASFDRLCDNWHPLMGERLTARMKSDRTVGNDSTFDVPKSVSVLYEMTQDVRIRDAFRESVQEKQCASWRRKRRHACAEEAPTATAPQETWSGRPFITVVRGRRTACPT